MRVGIFYTVPEGEYREFLLLSGVTKIKRTLVSHGCEVTYLTSEDTEGNDVIILVDAVPSSGEEIVCRVSARKPIINQQALDVCLELIKGIENVEICSGGYTDGSV